MNRKSNTTSWESSQQWYRSCVGEKGHYYHKKIIIPQVLSILKKQSKKNLRVIDFACGTGVLERAIPKTYEYVGLDISASFIKHAKEHAKAEKHTFKVFDITKPYSTEEKFDAACIILALQNIATPEKVFKNIYKSLNPGGIFIAVLNHPCFRIPRQSSWEVDNKSKVQYRKISSYMSEQKIPIQTHPSQKGHSPVTHSFHSPLSSYVKKLKDLGFTICDLQEWCSDKKSEGPKAKMEDRARKEFPLFLCWTAKK